MTATEYPRIYVACLAAYNSGALHGVWIDLDGKDAKEVWAEVNEMLAKSPTPNVMRHRCECADCDHEWIAEYPAASCPECEGEEVKVLAIQSAEEYAIHDYENFCGVKVNEYDSIDSLVELAEVLEEHGEAYAVYRKYIGDEYATVDEFTDAYQGEWASEVAFAENLVDDGDMLAGIPENLRYYFDCEKFARDLFIDDYFSATGDSGQLYVFARI